MKKLSQYIGKLKSQSKLIETISVFILAFTMMMIVLTGKVDDTSSDPFVSMYTALQLIDQQSLNLDPYTQLHQRVHIRYINGHYYDYFPPGSAIFSVPLVLLHKILSNNLQDVNKSRWMQKNIAAIVSTISLILGFYLARNFLPTRSAVVITSIFFFATPLMSTMSTALWNMNFTVLWMLAGLLIISKKQKLPIYLALVLGFCLFASFICRPTAIFYILSVFIVLFFRDKKSLIWTMIASASLLLVFMLMSLNTFNSIFPPYYMPTRISSQTFNEAFWGNLFSPSRGILIFMSFFSIIIYWSIRHYKQINSVLFFTLSAWIISHFLLVANFQHWWGGASYGPRLLTDSIPAWFLLSILAYKASVANVQKTKPVWSNDLGVNYSHIIFYALSAISIYIHSYQGVYNLYSTEWNRLPGIDEHHEQIFDWKYPQFLHSASRHTQRYQQYLTKNEITLKSNFNSNDLYVLEAEKKEDKIIVDNKKGLVFFGPYIELPPGKYKFSIEYEYSPTKNSSNNAIIGYWHVIQNQPEQRKIIAQGQWDKNKQNLDGVFSISSVLSKIEIHPYFDGDGKIVIKNLLIKSL